MPKPTDYDKTHLRNMAAIGTRIDRIFKKAAEEAAKIGVSIKTTLPEDRIFSFDDYPETKKQIERLMTALQESMETTIVSGVRSAWTLSNNKNNALVSRIFGDRVGELSKEQYRRYFSTNGAALDAFLQRKAQGLNLSDRVWRYTESFKREIELGLDLGIRTGESAAQMSRSLRQYLQHPDKLFRRVRDKHGNLRLSQAARDFHPGRGVYRSSYKNARRLACTETNMAYRTSDHLRWQQMEFVVGIEIKLSNNHTLNGVPLTDICDTLAGRYPKDFKFTGWHPHCRCHVVTVLKTEEEMAEDTQRILAGEQPEKGSVNTVRDVPAAFKGWVEEHADRIEMGGNLPYFVADNRKRVDTILGIATEPQKTPLEIAQERHDARTPEQAAAIQQRWNETRLQHLAEAIDNGYLPKEVKEQLGELLANNSPEHFEEIKARIAYLQKTAQRHAARTPQEIEDIKKAWEAKLTRDRNTRIMANNILKLRSEYPLDVDFSALEKIVADNNLTKMREEARNVAQAIKTIRAEEKALSDIIPNVHEWHKHFSIAQLQETKSNVLRTFSKKGWGWDINNATELDALRRGLEHEVTWMGTKGKARYATWEVSQSAYREKLTWAEKRIEMLGQKNAIEDEIKRLRTSRSTVGKQLVADFDKLFTDDSTDINVLRAKAADIKAKADQLEKLRAKKTAASATAPSGIPFGGMTDEEAKKALIDYANKIGTRIDPSKIVVDHGFIHLQGDQQMYLYEALKAETAAEHKQLWNHAQIGGGHGGRGGYVQTGNSFVINGKFRNNGIFGKIDSNVESQLRAAGITADDIKTIKLLDKKIEEFSMPVPILATRYVDVDALTNIFGQSVKGKGRGTTVSTLESWKKAVEKLPTKNMQVDPAYLSASLNEMQNVFYGNYRVKLQIEIPPGTPMYMTDNYAESEIVLGRGTQLEFIGVSIQTITRNFGWAGDQQYHHVTIRCRVKR